MQQFTIRVALAPHSAKENAVSLFTLDFLGLGILASPLVLKIASLIPLGISIGLAEEYFPAWKKYFKWFAAVGYVAIALTSLGGMDLLKKIVVPLFHSVAGPVISLGPFFAKSAPKGFFSVGIGGLLIGMGGIVPGFAKKDNASPGQVLPTLPGFLSG